MPSFRLQQRSTPIATVDCITIDSIPERFYETIIGRTAHANKPKNLWYASYPRPLPFETNIDLQKRRDITGIQSPCSGNRFPNPPPPSPCMYCDKPYSYITLFDTPVVLPWIADTGWTFRRPMQSVLRQDQGAAGLRGRFISKKRRGQSPRPGHSTVTLVRGPQRDPVRTTRQVQATSPRAVEEPIAPVRSA